MAKSKIIGLAEARELVEVGIVTMKTEELQAVLQRFPREFRVDGQTQYNVSRFFDSNGRPHYAAIIRTAEQGDISAQSAAKFMIDDLKPNLIVLIGIAGAIPAQEFTLGDVIVATRMYDFTVHATNSDGSIDYSTRSTPAHRVAQAFAANLVADLDDFGAWNSEEAIGMPRPPVRLIARNFTGDATWAVKVRRAMQPYFGKGGHGRQPKVLDGAIGTASTLVKDPNILRRWLNIARDLKAVDMEISGVYEAARSIEGDVPVVVIRGLSDVIGFKRDEKWTEYACHSAASFLFSFLAAGILGRVAREDDSRKWLPPSRRLSSSKTRHLQEEILRLMKDVGIRDADVDCLLLRIEGNVSLSSAQRGLAVRPHVAFRDIVLRYHTQMKHDQRYLDSLGKMFKPENLVTRSRR